MRKYNIPIIAIIIILIIIPVIISASINATSNGIQTFLCIILRTLHLY